MKEKHSDKKFLLEELSKLQKITGIYHHFDVVWHPRNNSQIEGKVEENTITIYSENIEDALDTLRHEFVDFIISNAIKPYIMLVNRLMSIISKDAYNKKEEAVEALLKLRNYK